MNLDQLATEAEALIDAREDAEGMRAWLDSKVAGLSAKVNALPGDLDAAWIAGFAMGLILERHDSRSVYLDSDRRRLVLRGLELTDVISAEDGEIVQGLIHEIEEVDRG